MVEEKQDQEERPNPYRLNLIPGEEQRREQWNLIFVSDVPVSVDFFHTDMLEKVIYIRKADLAVGEKKEGGAEE